jgi:hypothetical protein
LKWPEREPSRFAADGNGEALKICRLLSASKVLRTETVRAPGKLTHYRNSIFWVGEIFLKNCATKNVNHRVAKKTRGRPPCAVRRE